MVHRLVLRYRYAADVLWDALGAELNRPRGLPPRKSVIRDALAKMCETDEVVVVGEVAS